MADFMQRREEQLLEEVARNPYDPEFTLTQIITPSQVSAINFISKYLQSPAENLGEVYNSFFRNVQIVTHALFARGNFRPHKTFSWQGFGQTTEPIATQKTEVHNPSIYNDILNEFPNQELTAQRIHEIATNNYIQQFLSFFNDSPENITFPRKKDVLKSALKNEDECLSRIIREQMRTKRCVTFGDAETIDEMRIIPYGRIERHYSTS